MPRKKITPKKKVFRSRKKIGQSPGTITYTGYKEDKSFHIELIDYTPSTFREKEFAKLEEAFEASSADSITWININGLNNTADIQKLGKRYSLHPLVLEDIVDTDQRPKIEEYNTYVFVVFKMLYYQNDVLNVEHISMVLGKNYVLTFQEADGDVFNPLRTRIKEAKGRIRTEKSDYLLFALLDAIVDHYFLVIETLGEKIELIEDTLFNEPDDTITRQIQDIKKEALKIRRAVFPAREVIGRLEKIDSLLFNKDIRDYYRDLYDHTIQIIENIEIYRDTVWGLMDTYMSTVSNRMNNVMKVLTIIATIFIPLTFIAGIYGMNFEHMPELHYKYSYYILLGAMLVIFVLMLFYFKRKKWL
ncbi:magnesium/cobalt transporter CorA [Leptobacterium sp. I13]|uniref:magnesium/cobalt transporter CorA n=1 Tax=Leptobacterium meishanense TaxID=3128904 RepID=UPI0030ECA534